MIKNLLVCFAIIYVAITPLKAQTGVNTDPTKLMFHRLAARRFIFSNNIQLNELQPKEIIDVASMHPALIVSSDEHAAADNNPQVKLHDGLIEFESSTNKQQKITTINVGGVNPYATYEVDVAKITGDINSTNEFGIDLASVNLRKRVQVVVRYGIKEKGVYLRLYNDGRLICELCFANDVPAAPYQLKVQLAGRYLAVFVTDNSNTRIIGHTLTDQSFGDIIDFRDSRQCANAIFNLIANVAPGNTVKINSARSYLSPGVGQADIRLITHKDGSPYFENGKVWFTFSCRGLDLPTSSQGVMSFNPSVGNFMFEGMIVFDHGDGLLRNDYASHIFYDDASKEWCALVCDFGGSLGLEQRGSTGLIAARSANDPRFGFSVMQAKALTLVDISGRHEDPCIIYDAEAKKWRLLTSSFTNGNIAASLFESDRWDGDFKKIAGPVPYNSTGTLIQKVGSKYYAFSGGKGPMSVYSYPQLNLLGNLQFDLPPGFPKEPGRVWPTIFPLPAGYPYKYMLLSMDRDNFTGVHGFNWSYGALYLFGAL
jgi:hypothetical protein